MYSCGSVHLACNVPHILVDCHFVFRFFYESIWREWDEDEDGDYSYVARYLETRLQLYHDIKEGNLPKDLINRYRGKY